MSIASNNEIFNMCVLYWDDETETLEQSICRYFRTVESAIFLDSDTIDIDNMSDNEKSSFVNWIANQHFHK